MKRTLLFAALLLSLAPATRADDMEDCSESQGTAKIESCTRLIDSKRLQGATLAAAFNNRGFAKRRMRVDLAGAVADFGRAIELDPKNDIYYLNRGIASLEDHNPASSVSDLGRAIELNPENRVAWHFRALAKRVSGDREGAIADFTRQIELEAKQQNVTNAQRALGYQSRGEMKASINDHDGAVADFTRAIELDPNLAIAFAARGAEKRTTGDSAGALADLNTAIQLDQNEPLAYVGRGLMRQDKEDFAGAIADFNRVVELAPKNPSAYRFRGTARERNGEFDGAIADFNRGLELAPQDDRLLRVRGMALFLKNEPAPAAEDLARAQQRKADPYGALWLYLARARTNTDGAGELAANTASLDKDKWPAPIVALYLGHGTPEQLLAAARNKDAKTEQGQVCEANFYVAEWHLLKDDRKAALPLLRAAAALCPRDFVELAAAAVDLKRLEQPPKR